MVGIGHCQFLSLKGVDIWDYLGLDPTDRSLTLARAQAAAHRVAVLLQPDRRNSSRLCGLPVPDEDRFSSIIANEIAAFLNPDRWPFRVSQSTIMNCLTAPRAYQGHRSTWNPQQIGHPNLSAGDTDWNFIMTTTAHQHVFPAEPSPPQRQQQQQQQQQQHQDQQRQQQSRSRTRWTTRSPSVVPYFSSENEDDGGEGERTLLPDTDYSSGNRNKPKTSRTGFGKAHPSSRTTGGRSYSRTGTGHHEHGARPADSPQGSMPSSPNPHSPGACSQSQKQRQRKRPQQRRRIQRVQTGNSPVQPVDVADPESIDNLLALAQAGGVVVALVPRPNDSANARAHRRFWHIVEASLNSQNRLNFQARNFNYLGAPTDQGYGRQSSVSFDDISTRGRLLGRFRRANDRNFVHSFLLAMQAGPNLERPGDRHSEERRQKSRAQARESKRKRSRSRSFETTKP